VRAHALLFSPPPNPPGLSFPPPLRGGSREGVPRRRAGSIYATVTSLVRLRIISIERLL